VRRPGSVSARTNVGRAMSSAVATEGQEPRTSADTAKNLLLRHPGCAYTALLVTPSGQALDWELHCQRLARWAAASVPQGAGRIGQPPRAAHPRRRSPSARGAGCSAVDVQARRSRQPIPSRCAPRCPLLLTSAAAGTLPPRPRCLMLMRPACCLQGGEAAEQLRRRALPLARQALQHYWSAVGAGGVRMPTLFRPARARAGLLPGCVLFAASWACAASKLEACVPHRLPVQDVAMVVLVEQPEGQSGGGSGGSRVHVHCTGYRSPAADVAIRVGSLRWAGRSAAGAWPAGCSARGRGSADLLPAPARCWSQQQASSAACQRSAGVGLLRRRLWWPAARDSCQRPRAAAGRCSAGTWSSCRAPPIAARCCSAAARLMQGAAARPPARFCWRGC
jgi:hypothetical protein